MKSKRMTIDVDETLLKRVMRNSGFSTGSDAVNAGLKALSARISQRIKFDNFCKKGLGLTPDELNDAVDPDYDILAIRNAGIPRYGKAHSH